MDRQQLIRRGLAVALVALILAAPAAAVGAHLAGWQPLVERSASMAPVIRVGNLVLVQRVPAAAVRVGDVVTFADPFTPGRTLTHRVVGLKPIDGGVRLGITTRGDANRGSEHWTIDQTGTVGRMRAALPMPRFVAGLIDRSPSRGIMMALLAALSLVMTLLAIWRRPAPCAPTIA